MRRRYKPYGERARLRKLTNDVAAGHRTAVEPVAGSGQQYQFNMN